MQKKLHLNCLTEFWIHLCINYFHKTISYLSICLLNLINIFHRISVLCTVKSTWPYVQHICLITNIIIVFPNHMLLYGSFKKYVRRSLETSSFWSHSPPCSFLFILHVPPLLSKYICFSELTPLSKKVPRRLWRLFRKKVGGWKVRKELLFL